MMHPLQNVLHGVLCFYVKRVLRNVNDGLKQNFLDVRIIELT